VIGDECRPLNARCFVGLSHKSLLLKSRVFSGMGFARIAEVAEKKVQV
jgi:hypothetical protein